MPFLSSIFGGGNKNKDNNSSNTINNNGGNRRTEVEVVSDPLKRFQPGIEPNQLNNNQSTPIVFNDSQLTFSSSSSFANTTAEDDKYETQEEINKKLFTDYVVDISLQQRRVITERIDVLINHTKSSTRYFIYCQLFSAIGVYGYGLFFGPRSLFRPNVNYNINYNNVVAASQAAEQLRQQQQQQLVSFLAAKQEQKKMAQKVADNNTKNGLSSGINDKNAEIDKINKLVEKNLSKNRRFFSRMSSIAGFGANNRTQLFNIGNTINILLKPLPVSAALGLVLYNIVWSCTAISIRSRVVQLIQDCEYNLKRVKGHYVEAGMRQLAWLQFVEDYVKNLKEVDLDTKSMKNSKIL